MLDFVKTMIFCFFFRFSVNYHSTHFLLLYTVYQSIFWLVSKWTFTISSLYTPFCFCWCTAVGHWRCSLRLGCQHFNSLASLLRHFSLCISCQQDFSSISTIYSQVCIAGIHLSYVSYMKRRNRLYASAFRD